MRRFQREFDRAKDQHLGFGEFKLDGGDNLLAVLNEVPAGQIGELRSFLSFRIAARVLPIAVHEAIFADHSSYFPINPSIFFFGVAASGAPQLDAKKSQKEFELPQVLSNVAFNSRSPKELIASREQSFSNATFAISCAILQQFEGLSFDQIKELSKYASQALAPYNINSELWRNVWADIFEPSGLLWIDGVPEEMSQIWSESVRQLSKKGDHWKPCLDWYGRVVAGEPWNEYELGESIIEMPNKLWREDVELELPRFEASLEHAFQSNGDSKQENGLVDNGSGTGFTPKALDTIAVKSALVKNRKKLPPTLETILGYIELEIDRLQGKNFRSNEDKEETIRQINALESIYVAVSKLKVLVPKNEHIQEESTIEACSLIELIYSRIKEWPRSKPGDPEDNVADLVDNSYRVAMIGGFVYAAPMLAVSTDIALIAGAALFGGKKIVDGAKAGKDILKNDT